MKFRLIIDQNCEEEVVATVRQRSAITDRIEQLIREESGSSHITAYTEDELVVLSFDQIECITVENSKTCAIDSEGKHYRLKQRLYELEAILPAYFIRINKSALANEKRLDRFVATYSGGVNARFLSGYEEYVSRRCFAVIRRRFESK
jgi:DNA-binding LytR/AlgR family response regulator